MTDTTKKYGKDSDGNRTVRTTVTKNDGTYHSTLRKDGAFIRGGIIEESTGKKK